MHYWQKLLMCSVAILNNSKATAYQIIEVDLLDDALRVANGQPCCSK
jgi:hypothetical protein